MRSALLLLASAGSLVAPAASADVPAWTDDPTFESFCATLVERAACPACTCEAVTQSNPTEDASEASDIPSAIIIRVNGVKDDGSIVSQYRVVLGAAEKLFDGGVVGDASGHMGNPRETTVDIVDSAQRYDMCPGMCPHDPVGMIHAFEIKTTATEPTDKDPEVHAVETRTDLALCFAPDGAPGCWLLPLSASAGTVKGDGTAKGASKVKTVWSRTWKLSGSGEVELTLGKAKGKAPAAVGKAAKLTKTHLKELRDRPDATPAGR